MAFALTNKLFLSGVEAYVPAAHKELADQTMVAGTVTTSTVDTGIVGLKWIRVRAFFKTLTGLTAAEKVSFNVQAGTGSALTAPGGILFRQAPMQTNDTYIILEGVGSCNAGFQSYAITLNANDPGDALATDVTAVCDLMIDCC